MPRIRSLKPEMWDSRDVLAMDDAFQALWCWLITQADDAGRLCVDTAYIALRRRRSPPQIEARLNQMEARGMILRYEVDGRPYIALRNWDIHQRVEHPSRQVLPAPPNGAWDSPGSREASRAPTTPHEASRIPPPLGEKASLDEAGRPTRGERTPSPRVDLRARGTGSDRIGPDRINTVNPEGELLPPKPPTRKSPPILPQRVREHMNYGAALEEAAERLEARGE